MQTVDSLDAGIIWSRLVSVADEMVSALIRTSFSTMVRESGDFSCMLFDERGRLMAQGTASVPSFTGTGPATIRAILEKIPVCDLRDGDVVVTNDPWIGTGHVYDINVVKPIFFKDRVVAFALSVSHLADIGGIGYGTDAKDVYEEGICIPPVKLVSEGERNEFVFDLIEANVRFRELVLGDIYSNIAACNVAAKGVVDLLEEYELPDLQSTAEKIFSLTRLSVQDALTSLPRGEFKANLTVEGVDDGESIELAMSVMISDNGFTFDASGTGPIVSRGINVPLCYTRAYCNFSFKSIVAPDIPNNQALLDFVRVSAPENCILHALRPAPTGGRHILGHYVAPLIFSALSDVIPDKVQSDSGMICQVNFRGTAPNGRKYSFILFTSGGYGAFSDMDGRAALPGPSNMIGIPIEIWEDCTGLTVLRKEIRPDSGGAGEFQGGAGQIIEVRNDTGSTVEAVFFGSRTRLPARGFLGGSAGAIRSLFVDGKGVSPKARIAIESGSTIQLLEAGGGGFGDPLERTIEQILRDIRQGIISTEYAKEHYGLVARER
ncbi:hydantoinase B/oxoprolinase family protein [Paraburkholderia sp.]|uniref:hydantoinase B/oxoprolinase family protein n=1 Tax=Paraburkholderia sp. TaxID=1926495 RepID=UPI003C7A30B3